MILLIDYIYNLYVFLDKFIESGLKILLSKCN